MQPDLKNKQLPKGWVKDRIGSRVRVNYGKSQSGIRETGGKIPIYGTGGLIEHGKEALCLGDSVLIGRKGTLGNPLYLEHPFWPVDTTYYTSDFDGCTKWFFYLMQTLGLEKLNEATGVPSLSRGTFNRLEVPFPPKPEQEKIAEILTTIDQAIEQKAALITKYQRIKMGLMQDLFTCGIDENGCLRDPTTHKFKPSPLGQIPEEWDIDALESQIRIIDCKHYTPPFTASGYAFVRPRNVKIEGLDLKDVDFISERDFLLLTDKHRPVLGDIIFSRNASFGVACYVDKTIPFAIGQDTVVMTRSRADTRFVYHFLSSPIAESQIRNLSTGSTFGRINLTLIRKLRISTPPKMEQRRIAEVLDLAGEAIGHQKQELDKLQKLKTGLIQDLLTGKVSVESLLAEEDSAR